MTALYPAIPAVTDDKDSLVQAVSAIKQTLEILTGKTGLVAQSSPLSSVVTSQKNNASVTWQDLVNLGLVQSNLQSYNIITPWMAYTPIISAFGGGSFTTVSATGRYKQLGKTFFVQIDISITNVGTAMAPIGATLPAGLVAAGDFEIIVGREMAATGKMAFGYIGAGLNVMKIGAYDNSSLVVNGYNPVVNGVIEIQ